MLEIHVQDADMTDWIVIRHAGGCAPLSGDLRIDFRTSAGDVVIDTEYGGGGVLHPRPVEVLQGPADVGDVRDGARQLDIALWEFSDGVQAVLTLDMDSLRNAAGPGQGSVVATGADIAGAVASFSGGSAPVEAVFDDLGSAYLTVPCLPPGLSSGDTARVQRG